LAAFGFLRFAVDLLWPAECFDDFQQFIDEFVARIRHQRIDFRQAIIRYF
jgi:hypothetical protein